MVISVKPNPVPKKILYIDMDNVLVDFQSGIDQLDLPTRIKYLGRYDEVPGIFSKMLPFKDAIESFNELSEHFDTYILSTSPWENHSAPSDKLKWVKTYLGNKVRKRLILTHRKDLNIGDFLVDDRTKNGAGEFKGEFIQFGTTRFPDWITVKKYLMENK
jgi:5'-nucleotidase